MIILDYQFSKYGLKKLENLNMKFLDRTDLEYRKFGCDIIFRVNGHNFDAKWGWIPLFEFAKYMYLIIRNLSVNQTKDYDFTECGDYFRFERTEFSKVIITVNYNNVDDVVQTTEANYQELLSVVSSFYDKVFLDLQTRWPDLLENPLFLENLADFNNDLKAIENQKTIKKQLAEKFLKFKDKYLKNFDFFN